jgi:adenylate cyclase class 2
MYVEIEAKLKVKSLESVEQALAERGVSMSSETVQTDAYFDTADRTLTRTDQCIRLRTQSEANGERIILTYKGAKQVHDFKKREEVNIELQDAAAMERLLESLGYHKVLAFNKIRRTWRIDDCEVALDELPLIGAFVEIEGPDSAHITDVQRELRLGDTPNTTESYACLIQAELSRRGAAQHEVYL